MQTAAEKRVCNLLIPKGRFAGYTHPPVFDKRGCKLLKTKEGIDKKRGKRFQEAATD